MLGRQQLLCNLRRLLYYWHIRRHGIYVALSPYFYNSSLFDVKATYILASRYLSLKENQKFKKKFEKRGAQCLLSLSVCLSVRPAVRGLLAIVFGLGGWNLVWRILRWTSGNTFFLLVFLNLRFDLLMAIFRPFLAVFGLFCVCPRPVVHSFWPRGLKFGIKDS